MQISITGFHLERENHTYASCWNRCERGEAYFWCRRNFSTQWRRYKTSPRELENRWNKEGADISSLYLQQIVHKLPLIVAEELWFTGEVVIMPEFIERRAGICSGKSHVKLEAWYRKNWKRTRMRTSPAVQYDWKQAESSGSCWDWNR